MLNDMSERRQGRHGGRLSDRLSDCDARKGPGEVSPFLLASLAAAVLLAAHIGIRGDSAAASSEPARTAVPAGPLAGDVERGRYLVEDVAMCGECHSPRDRHGRIIPSARFLGAPVPFRSPWPIDWAIRAPRNRGLPGYSYALGIRLLTQGSIDRTGRQLRPPMPRYYMTPQDAVDVVAYLKSFDTNVLTER